MCLSCENADWVYWQTNVLLKRNAVENVLEWTCGRPTSLQDRTRDSDDDDDYQDKDYDVATLANNLSQAFQYEIYSNDDNEEEGQVPYCNPRFWPWSPVCYWKTKWLFCVPIWVFYWLSCCHLFLLYGHTAIQTAESISSGEKPRPAASYPRCHIQCRLCFSETPGCVPIIFCRKIISSSYPSPTPVTLES